MDRGGLGRGVALGVVALLVGCTPGIAPPAGAPVPDPAASANEIERASAPGMPRQANFRWELNEAGSRLSGQGVARFVAPARLRLDLFGPRGETYLAAALVDEEFRVPAGVAERFALPSPALLWAATGVVRPPADAAVQSVTRDGEHHVLRYALPDERILEYRVAGETSAPRLDRVEVRGRGGLLEWIELSRAPDGGVEQARYRDVAAFRELTLRMDRITDVASFGDEIWTPANP